MTNTESAAKPAKPQPRITAQAANYWEQARQNKLVLPYCARCEAPFYYPRHWCPKCFNQDLSWREMSGRAKVYSFSIIHQSPLPSYQGDVPYVLAVVELDEGPRMMTNIVECAPEEVRVDMALEVTFESRSDMKLPQFRPVTV